MPPDTFSWIAVTAIFVATSTILLHPDWRIVLAALALQYISTFWLVTRHLPLAMGSAKLITGWMVVAIVGMTRLNATNMASDETALWQRGQWFKAVMLGIAAVITLGVTPSIETAVPGIGLPVVAGGILLIGSGIILLGLNSDFLRITVGLLTVLAGFEILYSALESSILVTGLLAIINLGVGMVGSYLMTAGSIPFEPDGDDL